MRHVQDANLSIMLSTPSVLSTAQAIKLAHSCVRYRNHFEICFVCTPGAASYHYIPLRSYLLQETFISPEELFIVRSFISQHEESLAKGFPFMILKRSVLQCTGRGRSMLAPPLRGGNACPSLHETMSRILSVLRK